MRWKSKGAQALWQSFSYTLGVLFRIKENEASSVFERIYVAISKSCKNLQSVCKDKIHIQVKIIKINIIELVTEGVKLTLLKSLLWKISKDAWGKWGALTEQKESWFEKKVSLPTKKYIYTHIYIYAKYICTLQQNYILFSYKKKPLIFPDPFWKHKPSLFLICLFPKNTNQCFSSSYSCRYL